MDKVLSVRLNGKFIGILGQNTMGDMIFTYNSDVSQPLSLSLPIKEEPYIGTVCKAYFGGLLPESDKTRIAIGQKFGINPNNDFSLLRAIGNDCAGAVSFNDPDDEVDESEFVTLKGKLFSEEALAKFIKELPEKPLVDDMRLSLAGAQDKTAVCLIDNQVYQPKDSCPTTHILKPAMEHFEGSIENEYLCLRVAKHLKINVPNVEIRQADGVPYLLIERYDRQINDGKIKRIHQEDFCQALGIVTAYKYQRDGGPSNKDCFDLMQKMTVPAIDRNQLAERIIFNYLIGNADAHGKNFSLLHNDINHIQLAPAYDILSTCIYEKLSKKMAMKIGSNYQINTVRASHWAKFCNESNYSYYLLEKLIKRQIETLIPAIEKELVALQERKLNNIGKKILNYAENSCKALQRELGL